jgi:uncharacterized protein (TIGR02421 family)
MFQSILEPIERQESVHHLLSEGGVLHLDRGLPFLLVYREPGDRKDAGTARLVATEAAYLAGKPGEEEEVASLVRRIATSGSSAYGAFLVLEIWTSTDEESRSFVVNAPAGPAPETVGRLVQALEAMTELEPRLEVAVDSGDERHPPGLPPLLSIEESWQSEVLLIGLEVPPIFRDGSGDVYPRFLRVLQNHLSTALRRALYEFVRVQTSSKVRNHLALGTRTPPDAVWEVDRELCAIEHSFDLLMLTSPVNTEEAWDRFQANQYDRDPELHYRLLPIDPDLLKRRLYALRIETIDDPALADLFEDKRQELDTQITMLRERGSDRFRFGSQRLYGRVDERLHSTARTLLDEVEVPSRWDGDWVDEHGFLAAARAELDRYREQYPEIRNTVEIRRDVVGLMVSEGNLMVGKGLRIRADRVSPLIHHEVGTHVLTHVNGSAQPLEQLALGLADYDEFQEGLAVLSEYLVGGLDRLRMRLLGARVLAAARVEEGATFVETFRYLNRELGFSRSGSWHIAVRVHASGGFTRDMIYLRGLVDVLALLRDGAELEPLYIGKMARKHIPIIEELRYREVLRKPPLSPRFLQDPDALERLAAVRRGITLTEMICPENE